MRPLPTHARDVRRARARRRGASFREARRALPWLLALAFAGACTARNPAFEEPSRVGPVEADAGEETSPIVSRDAAPRNQAIAVDAAADLAPEPSIPDAAVPVDAAVFPDVAPDQPVDKAPPPAALLVVGDTSLSKSDTQLRTSLEGAGFTVSAKTGTASAAADAAGKALVIISGSAVSADVNSKFTNVAVPVVVFDDAVFAPMKLTGTRDGTDYGSVLNDKRVAIVDATQPLAAGLTGTITVTDANIEVSWGIPSSSAIKVASVAGQTSHFTLFAYEVGSTMVGMSAPARRVGAFVRYPDTAGYTSDGLALFDAIVQWATATPQN